MENNYTYYSAVNKDRLSILKNEVGNIHHAMVLDQFAFWSINSKFILPKEDKPEGWFCRLYKDIGEQLGYSESYITKLIKKFVSSGLIEKTKKKLKGDTRACLRATEKLRNLIAKKVINTSNTSSKLSTSIHCDANTECSESNQNNRSKTNILAGPIYIDQNDSSSMNNITYYDWGKNVGKGNLHQEYADVFKEVGERLEQKQKFYLAKTVENLFNQHKIRFSGSKFELFAQLVFSTLSKDVLPKEQDFFKRINIFSKLIRNKRWGMPKGFAKYCDIGAKYEAQRDSTGVNVDKKPKKIVIEGEQALFEDLDTYKKQYQLEIELKEIEKRITQTKLALSDVLGNIKALPRNIKACKKTAPGSVASLEKTLVSYQQQKPLISDELSQLEQRRLVLKAQISERKSTYDDNGEVRFGTGGI